MTVQVSRLRAAGIAKESVLGTPITTPTRYLNIVPPDSFTPMIEPLPSKGIQAIRDMYPKITQGPGTLNGMKVKLEMEPENIGEILQALFGLDTQVEVASFVVTLNTNDKINFKESGGAQITGTLAAGTYKIGASSATGGTLCAAVKTAMDAAVGAIHTYTVTYSFTTKKMTITPNAGTIQILWSTGTNAATSARTLLGFTAADTSNAAAVTSDSTTQTAPWSHVFTAQAVSVLPTLTWWFDKNPKYQIIAGAMASKLDIDIKAKGIIEADTDWIGTVYDDAGGSSKSPTFSSLRPFVWSQAVVSVDGSGVLAYDNLKLSIDNKVKADHALNNSIWPYTIYSEGFDVQLSAELFFENTTQYQKFLAGTTAAFIITITSPEIVGGLIPYSLTLSIPIVYYKTANLYIPSSGPLKVPFMGLCQPSSGVTMTATLVNSVATQY